MIRRALVAWTLVPAACVLAGCILASCSDSPERSRRANVLLVTLDTTRADRLSCYGYRRPTSPRIDELAREATLYTEAYSTTSWTLPSHASLFTGKLPTSHGARYADDGPLVITDAIDGPDSFQQYRARGLATDETTLAGLLAGLGWRTAGVVAGPWLKRPFGLDRGFEVWDDEDVSDARGRLAEQVTDRAIELVDGFGADPFLLFLNYYDPHSPYEAPGDWARAFLPEGAPLSPMDAPGKVSKRRLDALYDAEVRYMDHHFGRLLDHLREQGLLDSTWVVVTSDHGELLGEHGDIGHGKSLWQEELRIPLIVRRPGASARDAQRSDRPIQLTDVLPLIMEGLGFEAPPNIQGAAPAPGDPPLPVIAELYPLEFTTTSGDWRVFLHDRQKLHWSSLGDHRLYDLEHDERETTNIYASRRELAETYATALTGLLDSLPLPGSAGPAAELDEETRRALQGLGYTR